MFGVPSSSISAASIAHLVGRVGAGERGRDRLLDVLHGLLHALAEVALLVVVAQLDRFVLARARAARHGGAADDAAGEDDVGFDGGIAAAVEDLAGDDVGDDGGHDDWFRVGVVRRPDKM